MHHILQILSALVVQMMINRCNCYSDDDSAEAEGREWEDDYDFSSNFLAEIIEKSMWVFYEFLVSDKDDAKNILKCNRKHQIELQNSENPQLLLVNVQDHFQKVCMCLPILFLNSIEMPKKTMFSGDTVREKGERSSEQKQEMFFR